MSKETETKPFCCGNFEKMASAFKWFKFADEESDTLLMPCIPVNGTEWRVNYCPSCGAKVRDIELTKQILENGSLRR